jgi:hypothetical protein
VSWSAVWPVLGAVVLGALTNELCDLAPWLARRILRRAARIEASTRDEARLIADEYLMLLEDVPGKFSKLVFALGRFAFTLRFTASRTKRRWNSRIRNLARRVQALVNVVRAFLVPIVTILAQASLFIYIVFGQLATAMTSFWQYLTGVAGVTMIAVVGLLTIPRHRRDRHRNRGAPNTLGRVRSDSR